MGGYVEEGFEGGVFFEEIEVGGVGDFWGADHEVFGGVLGGDEFDDFGAVAHDAEDLGAEGVGGEVGEAVVEDAVVVEGGEDWCVEGCVEVFVAAGDGEEELGVGFDGECEGVVGGGVAGVEGEDDVGVEVFEGADFGGGEGDDGEAGGEVGGFFDEVVV